MSAKHTPGEWDVNEFTDLDGDHHVQVVLKSNGCPLARIYETGSETRANARLMAASPDLLEALRIAEHSVGDIHALEVVRAAIAKATGGAA